MSRKKTKPGKKYDKNQPHLIEIDHYTSEFDRNLLENENAWMEMKSTPKQRIVRQKMRKQKNKRHKLLREMKKLKRPRGVFRYEPGLNNRLGKPKRRRHHFIQRDRIQGLNIVREDTYRENEKLQLKTNRIERRRRTTIEVGKFETPEEKKEREQKEKLREFLRQRKNSRTR